MKRFIHIPKTAGTAIKHWLCDVDEIVMCGNSQITKTSIITKRQHKRGWLSEPSEKFTVVRNPYERCVSAYTYLIKENTRVPADTTFEHFVKKYVLNKNNNTDTWRPQVWWLLNKKGSMAVHKIIRYENLEKELQQYFDYYHLLPTKNKTTYTNWENYYTNELKQLVFNYYKKDFALLNYSE
jgi:hypothetical protein